MDFVQANGIVLHADWRPVAGRPALVFVNSLGTDFRIWDRVTAHLGRRFSILRFDERGHGLSGLGEPPYDLAVMAEDLRALLDHYGIEKAIVCGLSVGGMIAMTLAAAHPERVSGLILCDTAHRIGGAAFWAERIAIIERDGLEALGDPVMVRWFSESFRAEKPAETAAWRAMVVRQDPRGYAGTCAALRDGDLESAARGFRVPTLCVVGSVDGATPPDLVRSLADLIPDAGFAVIDGVGHIPCVEAPDVLVAHILRFTEENALV